MKLTESHLRNLIKQELKKTLKEMHPIDKAAEKVMRLMDNPPNYDQNVDDALLRFLKYEAEINKIYPINELAEMLETTPEKIVVAYNDGGDMFAPYEKWTTRYYGFNGGDIVKRREWTS